MSTEPQEDNQALLAQAEYYDAQAKIQAQQPSQAKDKAVADLTAACYQKASQLKLTREEIEALKADFPDDAFQPGAAGKENLIYIEHAALRERLDNVIGMGQWVMIPIRRWVEEFSYEKDTWQNNKKVPQTVKGAHVYVDAILVVRECFCASAIGEMTYYPDNHTQNYGDAVEGAETAALRRCCKRLGIGLQAWRKDWCLGWWKRKNAPRATATPKPPSVDPQPIKTAPSASQTPFQPPPGPSGRPLNMEKCRMKALNTLQAAPGQRNRVLVTDYLEYKGWITRNQVAEDWSVEHVPTSPEAMATIVEELQKFEVSQREQHQGITP